MRKKAVAALMGLMLPVFLIAVVELSFYFFNYQRPKLRPVPNQSTAPSLKLKNSLNTSLEKPFFNRKSNSKEDVDFNWYRPTRLPLPNMADYEFNKKFYQLEDSMVIAHEGTYEMRATDSVSGTEIFHATYTLGPKGYRVTPQIGARKKHLILLGDSFTFGFGVNDDQTMPAAIAKAQNAYRVYNFGFPQYALNSILLASQKRDYRNLVNEESGLVLYVYRSDHVTRTFGSFDYIARYGFAHPYFNLSSDGKVVHLGTFQSAAPFMTLLARLLFHSQIVQYYNLEWYVNNEKNWPQFIAECVLELKKNSLRHFPHSEFVLVVAPGESQFVQELLPEIDRREIKTLNYSDLDLREYVSGPLRIRGDGHYTPEGNRVWGEQLARDLQLNFK
jgi:hypothetical protein